jgi:hypothetical protein
VTGSLVGGRWAQLHQALEQWLRDAAGQRRHDVGKEVADGCNSDCALREAMIAT